MKYRLYIDEVGNSDLGSSKDPNHRYLSLTGVILNHDYVSTTVFPAIEALKRDYFNSHPDDPIILRGKIGEMLEASKYIRSPDGQIDKWGRKWLP